MMVKNDYIQEDLIEKILEKLEFAHIPDVSYESLTLIYQRWCQKIPFDNIMKRIHMELNMHRLLPGSYPKDFFENWIATGVGGTCWAGNGSFYALLNSLGFPAQLGVSTMISSSNSDVKNLPPHGTVIVNFGTLPMIVDTTMMHNDPIPLKDSAISHPLWETSTKWNGNNWIIEWNPLGRPRSNCRIDNLKVSESDFLKHYENSKELSRFNHSTIFRIVRHNQIEGIVLGNKVIRKMNGDEISIPVNSEMIKKILIEDYGILEELVVQIPDNQIV